jgi:RecA/RadA recombinase
VQDFEGNIVRRCKGKDPRPFIYILDSLDALTSDEEVEREYKNALARAKSADHAANITKSYNTEKARIIGRILRMVKANLKNTRSTLIMIQQERSAIGAGPFQKQWTTSGGQAPFFYSTHQVRVVRTGDIKPSDQKIGTKVKAEVIKNKLTGKKRWVAFDIYDDYGVDDIASCVEFLTKEYWPIPKGKKSVWDTGDLGVVGNRPTIIDFVEKEGAEREIRELVGKAWEKKESKLRLERKKKYE